MAKWHVSPDGVARRCSAEVRDCSYGHADSEAGAYALNERMMNRSGYADFDTVSKAEKKPSANLSTLEQLKKLEKEIANFDSEMEYGAIYTDEGYKVYEDKKAMLSNSVRFLDDETRREYNEQGGNKLLRVNAHHYSTRFLEDGDSEARRNFFKFAIESANKVNEEQTAMAWEVVSEVAKVNDMRREMYAIMEKYPSVAEGPYRFGKKRKAAQERFESLRAESEAQENKVNNFYLGLVDWDKKVKGIFPDDSAFVMKKSPVE